MRVDERVADALLRQILVEAREVAALRQPDAVGGTAKRVPVALDREPDLRADGGRELLHQRQVAVRRTAGHEVQLPGVAERAEGLNEVETVLLGEDPPAVGEETAVHLRERSSILGSFRFRSTSLSASSTRRVMCAT